MSEQEWKRLIPHHLSMPAAGSAFYARIFHPAFNIDVEEAEDAADRFDIHTKAVSKGVQGLRNVFVRVREARIGSLFHFIFIFKAKHCRLKKCQRPKDC